MLTSASTVFPPAIRTTHVPRSEGCVGDLRLERKVFEEKRRSKNWRLERSGKSCIKGSGIRESVVVG